MYAGDTIGSEEIGSWSSGRDLPYRYTKSQLLAQDDRPTDLDRTIFSQLHCAPSSSAPFICLFSVLCPSFRLLSISGFPPTGFCAKTTPPVRGNRRAHRRKRSIMRTTGGAGQRGMT